MKRDYFDLWGGALLALCGVAVAAYSVNHYEFGELRRIGPGFFPAVLGGVLACLGLAIAVPAFLRRGTREEVALKEGLFILVAVVTFALLVERAGVLLTTLIVVLIATVPATRPGWIWRIGVAVAVALITCLIFILGLGMTLPVLPRGL